MFRRATLSLAALATLAAPLNAQVQVSLSVFGGGFLPISDLFESIRVGDAGGPIVLNLGQEPALLAGGRVTFWLSRLGIEAEAGYGFSNLDLALAIVDAGVPDDAPLFLGSLNLMYVIFQAPFTPLSLHASAGGGIVSRGGDFLDLLDDTSDITGALGLGLRFGLGPAIRLRFDLKDYISSFAPTARNGFQFDSRLQNDLIATMGLEFVFRPGP